MIPWTKCNAKRQANKDLTDQSHYFMNFAILLGLSFLSAYHGAFNKNSAISLGLFLFILLETILFLMSFLCIFCFGSLCALLVLIFICVPHTEFLCSLLSVTVVGKCVWHTLFCPIFHVRELESIKPRRNVILQSVFEYFELIAMNSAEFQ